MSLPSYLIELLEVGPIFPVHGIDKYQRCTCRRRDCRSPGKAPFTQRGVHDATRDEAQITRWLREFPGCNWGIQALGLLFVDIDPRSGGHLTFASLEKEHGRMIETVAVRTGSNGSHYYLNAAEGLHFRYRLGPGIELLSGAGRYVVAPASRHVSGGVYAWMDGASPRDLLIAEPPAWLLRIGLELKPLVQPSPIIGAPDSTSLALAFQEAGLLLRVIDAERVAVRCPWSAQHSVRGGRNDSSTVLFAPTERRPSGTFHCSHAHCSGRTAREALAMLPLDALIRANSTAAKRSAA